MTDPWSKRKFAIELSPTGDALALASEDLLKHSFFSFPDEPMDNPQVRSEVLLKGLADVPAKALIHVKTRLHSHCLLYTSDAADE